MTTAKKPASTAPMDRKKTCLTAMPPFGCPVSAVFVARIFAPAIIDNDFVFLGGFVEKPRQQLFAVPAFRRHLSWFGFLAYLINRQDFKSNWAFAASL